MTLNYFIWSKHKLMRAKMKNNPVSLLTFEHRIVCSKVIRKTLNKLKMAMSSECWNHQVLHTYITLTIMNSKHAMYCFIGKLLALLHWLEESTWCMVIERSMGRFNCSLLARAWSVYLNFSRCMFCVCMCSYFLFSFGTAFFDNYSD